MQIQREGGGKVSREGWTREEREVTAGSMRQMLGIRNREGAVEAGNAQMMD